MPEIILEAVNVSRKFRVGSALAGGVVHAVNDVSLQIPRGSITAVVGESGCGKSTFARVLAQMDPQTSGELLFDGESVRPRKPKELRSYVGHVQLLLQDPYASLNPYKTVGHTLGRAVASAVGRLTPADKQRRVEALLEQVGLKPAAEIAERLPNELSGGQRQRVSIARGLAADPQVLIADEPVSMLDVSIRLGVLDLLRKLNEQGLTIVYITHDLPSARWFADTIAVMYAGRIVEHGPAASVVSEPKHPYTQLLLSSSPDPSRSGVSDAVVARGEPPSALKLAEGCSFAPRCPFAFDKCRKVTPKDLVVGPDHTAACWLHEEEVSRNLLESSVPSAPSTATSKEIQ